MTFAELLPMIIYILLIVLLIILIVLGIKLLCIINKTDKLITDIQGKIDSFNSIFKIIDFASERLSFGISSLFEMITNLFGKFIKKRKEEEDE